MVMIEEIHQKLATLFQVIHDKQFARQNVTTWFSSASIEAPATVESPPLSQSARRTDCRSQAASATLEIRSEPTPETRIDTN